MQLHHSRHYTDLMLSGGCCLQPAGAIFDLLVSSLFFVQILSAAQACWSDKTGIARGRRFRAITLTTSCHPSFRRQATLPSTSARPQSCIPAPHMQLMDAQPSSSVTSLRWSRSTRYCLPTHQPPEISCTMHCHTASVQCLLH